MSKQERAKAQQWLAKQTAAQQRLTNTATGTKRKGSGGTAQPQAKRSAPRRARTKGRGARGGVDESVEEAAMALVEFDLKGQLHTEVVNACIVVTFAEEDEDGGKVNRPYVGIVVSYDPTEGMDVQFGADDALYTITNEDDWHWGDNITNKVPMR